MSAGKILNYIWAANEFLHTIEYQQQQRVPRKRCYCPPQCSTLHGHRLVPGKIPALIRERNWQIKLSQARLQPDIKTIPIAARAHEQFLWYGAEHTDRYLQLMPSHLCLEETATYYFHSLLRLDALLNSS